MTAEQIFNGVILAAGAALAWALWQAARPRAEFRVRVVDGQAKAVEGTVTPAFLERFAKYARPTTSGTARSRGGPTDG